jgi:hypothetical protein
VARGGARGWRRADTRSRLGDGQRWVGAVERWSGVAPGVEWWQASAVRVGGGIRVAAVRGTVRCEGVRSKHGYEFWTFVGGATVYSSIN